jgi:ppGpp synthetase/RelA/SpoT-type nucleotidyltranferase
MADSVDKKALVYKKLCLIYENNVANILKVPCGELEKLFDSILNDKGEDYSLIKTNSVYSSRFFNVKSRVKPKTSFHEKLVRKNIGLHIVNKYSIIDEEGLNDEVTNRIKQDFQILDDIIGIRIVTDLKKDCDAVHKLLKNNTIYFTDKNIRFFDLDDQPQKMKNGLEIYRIKGLYQSQYGFELQIKSKIDEAWGELDHSLFYKDYSISPVKDSVQVTMNHVGELLDRIEHLLFDLRDSELTFIESSEHLRFQTDLEEEVSKILKDKFDVAFHLKDISFVLRFLKEEIGNPEVAKLTNISFEFLDWQVEDPKLKCYLKVRNSSHNLIVIESLFINWTNLTSASITEGSYHEHLQRYLQLFAKFLSIDLNIEDSGIFYNQLIFLLEKDCSSDIFFDLKKYQLLGKVNNKLDDLSGQHDWDLSLEKLKQAFQIKLFDGDIKSFLAKLKGEDYQIDSLLDDVKKSVRSEEGKFQKRLHDLSLSILEDIITI